MFERKENQMISRQLLLRAARAGFGVVWLGGVLVLAWTVLASILPAYQMTALA